MSRCRWRWSRYRCSRTYFYYRHESELVMCSVFTILEARKKRKANSRISAQIRVGSLQQTENKSVKILLLVATKTTHTMYIKLALPIITQHPQILLHSRVLVCRAGEAITEPTSRRLEEPAGKVLIPYLFKLRTGVRSRYSRGVRSSSAGLDLCTPNHRNPRT